MGAFRVRVDNAYVQAIYVKHVAKANSYIFQHNDYNVIHITGHGMCANSYLHSISCDIGIGM